MTKSDTKSMTARVLAAAILASVLTIPATGIAADAERAKQDAGIGLAAAMANIFYIPAKLTYAALGGVTGGLTYAMTLGNTEAAEKVWVASGGGDYVLSTEHMSGERRIHFTGGGTGSQSQSSSSPAEF